MIGTEHCRGPEKGVINFAWKSSGRHPRGNGISVKLRKNGYKEY
jgi:hypothetical protein